MLLKGRTRKSAGMLKSSFQISSHCCSTRCNGVLETSLASSPGNTTCVSILASVLLVLLWSLKLAPNVDNLVMISRNLTNLMVRGRSLGRCSQHSPSVCSSRLVGSTHRWPRACSTGGRRLRSFGENVRSRAHHPKSMTTFYLDRPTRKPLTTPLLTSMIPCLCYRLMAHNSTRTNSWSAGSTSGSLWI